jgi:hypothetical protein
MAGANQLFRTADHRAKRLYPITPVGLIRSTLRRNLLESEAVRLPSGPTPAGEQESVKAR